MYTVHFQKRHHLHVLKITLAKSHFGISWQTTLFNTSYDGLQLGGVPSPDNYSLPHYK